MRQMNREEAEQLEETKRRKQIEETERDRRPVMRGELALLIVVIINSLGVVLMLYSGSGISAISSVPYGFSEVLSFLSLGTWSYLFQGALVLSLMLMRRKFVSSYLFSFVIGFAFGKMLDVYNAWMQHFPLTIPFRIGYFAAGYILICVGIAFSNRCRLPIIPTDLFPREAAQITGIAYPKVKITFDVACLTVTAAMTGILLGQIKGIGIGTVMAALTMGKVVGMIGDVIDKHVRFVSVLSEREDKQKKK